MGLFDYVKLGRELEEKLGRYGRGLYKTKYIVEEGFLRVYNSFTKRHSLWRLHVWIELLLEPNPQILGEEPLLRTVHLDELGKLRLVEASVTLNTRVYDVNLVAEKLGSLGFQGPVRRVHEETRIATEPLCSIHHNGRVELELVRLEARDQPLGAKTLFRVKCGGLEMLVEPDLLVHATSSTITVERRKWATESIVVEEWSKGVSLEGFDAHVTVSVRRKGVEVEGWLAIQVTLVLEPQLIREEYIDKLVEFVEDTAKRILLS